MLNALNWYSDGWPAMLGLTLLSFILLALVLRGARACAPLSRILLWALLWHLIVYGYYVLWLLPNYGDLSDSLAYHNYGIGIAKLIHDGNWAGLDWGLSTKAMDLIVGFLYTPFGADPYGIALFSAVLGFAGTLYFCRAFYFWASPAQTRKYSIFLLFMPSFAMWTAILGKDSWIAFGLGLAAYGYSAIQRSANSGAWHLTAGLTITGIIRPHIALALVASMAAAYIWSLTKKARGSFVMKLFRVVALVGMVAVLYPLTLSFVGLSSDASAENVDEYVVSHSEANFTGGSAVEVHVAPGIGGAIRGFPRGVVRVLLEPFPWDVHSANAAMAAVENLFLGWLMFRQARHLRELFRQVVRIPYILFSAFSALSLLMMLSFVPNLGLISRQRVQLLPFLFAVLIAAEVDRKRRTQSSRLVQFPPRVAARTDRRVG